MSCTPNRKVFLTPMGLAEFIEYLKNAYQDGRLKSHRAFYEIVLRYVRDELKYVEYARLIMFLTKTMSRTSTYIYGRNSLWIN